MISYESKNITHVEIQRLLSGGIAPRPIALASTVSPDGIRNLSPFSFFNVFGSNPPIVAFSPSRRGRDGSLKDTYHNIVTTNEVVINAVTYDMVEQVNLASCDYGTGVDEFLKSGLTPLQSDLVKPWRVAESPFQMECRLYQMIELGGQNASGNLAICEVLKFHVAEEILRDGIIDPLLVDHVGRNGREYYTRSHGDSLFEIPKPGSKKGIGFDMLPDYIKESHIFSANNLARLALSESIPSKEEALNFISVYEVHESNEHTFYRLQKSKNYEAMLQTALYQQSQNNPKFRSFLEWTAKTALEQGDIDFAWHILIYSKV